MDRGDVQKLLDDFAKLVGMEALELDDSGRVGLAVDDAFTIDIEHDVTDDVLLLSVDLASLGAEPQPTDLLELLRGNFCFDRTAGATLALAGADNLVVLQQRLRPVGLDAGEIARAVEALTAAVDEWSTLINRMVKATADPAAPSPGEPPAGAVRV